MTLTIFLWLIGDLQQRFCTAAEIEFYAHSLFDSAASGDNYVSPNKNCNLTSWAPGCEPGWSCSVGKNKSVDLKNRKEMPARIQDCQPCCDGFFCPHGLTCMMRKYFENHQNYYCCNNISYVYYVLIIFMGCGSILVSNCFSF